MKKLLMIIGLIVPAFCNNDNLFWGLIKHEKIHAARKLLLNSHVSTNEQLLNYLLKMSYINYRLQDEAGVLEYFDCIEDVLQHWKENIIYESSHWRETYPTEPPTSIASKGSYSSSLTLYSIQ